jgi:hypothetical protein
LSTVHSYSSAASISSAEASISSAEDLACFLAIEQQVEAAPNINVKGSRGFHTSTLVVMSRTSGMDSIVAEETVSVQSEQ